MADTDADKTRVARRFERCVARSIASAGVRSVVAGVSGGADSTALLLALRACGVRVTALHCNFNLRGCESMRDEDFVRALCSRLNIPLEIKSFDTTDYAAQNRISIEMAARDLRYAFFRDVKATLHADRIAVAHNADDNAETLLLNLMRGSGISGLRAMRPDTGEIIRPLLSVTRTQILNYLQAKGEPYVTDSSNLENEYARNFIRNEVFPLLESRWPAAKASVCRSASLLRSEETMLDWLEGEMLDSDSTRLSLEDIRRCPDPQWIVRRFASRFGATPSQCSEMTAAAVKDDFLSGKHWIAGGGRIFLERDGLHFVPDISGRKDISASVAHEELRMDESVWSRIVSSPPDELWTTLAPGEICFRNVRTGDRMRLFGSRGSALVSKLMKDVKLSAVLKENAIVAESLSDGRIIWLAGVKRGGLYLVERNLEYVHHYRLKQ